MLEANAVREQEGVLDQESPNQRDTHVFVIHCILKGGGGGKGAKIFFSDCENTDAVSPSRQGCWKMTLHLERSRNKDLESAYSATFQKRVDYPEICLAAILILPYPGTQLNTPRYLAQNFIFPL